MEGIMLEKLKDYIRTHTEQVLRMSFGATFIFRGIMHMFPWIFIHEETKTFVIYPTFSQLLICALGLALVLIRWKPTNFRIFSIWVLSTAVWTQILIFVTIFDKYPHEQTVSFLIFTTLIIISWGWGSGIYIRKIFDTIIVYMVMKGYIKRNKKKLMKGKKKERKKRK
jgi:hypothetical protein